MTHTQRWLRRILTGAALAVATVAAGWLALDRWIEGTEMPPLAPAVSEIALDREGALLRAWQVSDGRWRLPVSPKDVDRGYLAQLIAYEDGRFHDHSGVDLLAMARAGWQALGSGRIVSGASTLTMQVARLLEEMPTGSVSAKVRQIRLALALERRLSKDEILTLYLTLAPFGGNIEGVRAATLAWFGKEPRRLTPAEAALLVALPQHPEGRRPDRHPAAARAARDRVLIRAAGKHVLSQDEALAARRETVPQRRRAFPALAPHLTDRARARQGTGGVQNLTIDAGLQRALETLVAERAATYAAPVSAAAMVVDHRTGEVLASVGSPGLSATDRGGFLDMTRAIRSPGSTLKPLIYGLAFDQRLAHPESLIDDRPTSFGAYTPTNFEEGYHGTVSLRTALQRSLNVPAVALLDGVGPARLMARMRRSGAAPILPPGKPPGLAVALGGVGMSLRDLIAIYTAIARGGTSAGLTHRATADRTAREILSPQAAWHIADILAGAPAPLTALNGVLAYKTGTSYGHRDAWAIGFDGAHVIGVWVGRPDAAPVPGITGIKTAAPILFEAFSRLKPESTPLAPPPPDTLLVEHAALPIPLRTVRTPGITAGGETPEIAFPPNGARIDMTGSASGLMLRIRDGRPPFSWLVDGRPIATGSFERELFWVPDTKGFLSIAVIDATGRAARARIQIL